MQSSCKVLRGLNKRTCCKACVVEPCLHGRHRYNLPPHCLVQMDSSDLCRGSREKLAFRVWSILDCGASWSLGKLHCGGIFNENGE